MYYVYRLGKKYESDRLICLPYPDRDEPHPICFLKHTSQASILKMLDSLSSYADLAMTSIFPKAFTTVDYAITIPFDIQRLSYFSLLRAKTLWQTKARWCWFEKASKEDDDAGTTLGTLRFLPYEVRQQIFEIVLEDHIVELEERFEQEKFIYNGRGKITDGMNRRMLLNKFMNRRSCSKRDKFPEVSDLRSYILVSHATEKLPTGLRFASLTIRQEFDDLFLLFLSRRTFCFTCPLTIHRFLSQLSSVQQRQLKHVHLSMLTYWACSPDTQKHRALWMTACERLPPGLKSVELQLPCPLRHITFFLPKRWGILLGDQAENQLRRLAMGFLHAVSKKISRALPQAVISWTGREKLGKEDSALLDAGIAELETWSEDWYTYVDGQNV